MGEGAAALRWEEAIMPFPVYAALLTSQLVVPIGDRVPEFDVGPSCHEATVPDCLNVEKIARTSSSKLGHTLPHRTRPRVSWKKN